ncbi:MAG TPA: DnaJ C-terminal domain-containing protein [Burkholderiales bacterium]|nr:DnaJ C-terminal domain-containing protein [Burkholderiales bacterium]
MEFRDYYQILGVSKTASTEDIRKAYRKLARKYHPDVSKEADAEKKMKEVNEANEVLSDPEKRAAYDQVGQGYRSGQEFKPPPDWNGGFEFSGNGFSERDMQNHSDFFANLFGRARRSRTEGPFQVRGEDRHAEIVIDLADTYRGTSKTLTLRVPATDRGQIAMKEKTVNIQIPKGVKAGQHIRLAGQGGAGSGGAAAGDLYLEVRFKADARFRVEERDVYETVPVTPWEAALGGSIEVPTPAGSVQVKIPENSQNGRKLRLKGRGIPGDPAGDLYLLLEIALPPADTERARKIYRNMAQELPFNPRLNMGV